jgi:hypothetical protein
MYNLLVASYETVTASLSGICRIKGADKIVHSIQATKKQYQKFLKMEEPQQWGGVFEKVQNIFNEKPGAKLHQKVHCSVLKIMGF